MANFRLQVYVLKDTDKAGMTELYEFHKDLSEKDAIGAAEWLKHLFGSWFWS